MKVHQMDVQCSQRLVQLDIQHTAAEIISKSIYNEV